MSPIDEKSIDHWLREFQIKHGDSKIIMSAKTLEDLAYALHDDIPLGYEASMRLGEWMLNAANLSGRETTSKNCPFCGHVATMSPAEQKEDGTWIPARCGCADCRVYKSGDPSYGHNGFAEKADYAISLEQAVKRWNMRAQ